MNHKLLALLSCAGLSVYSSSPVEAQTIEREDEESSLLSHPCSVVESTEVQLIDLTNLSQNQAANGCCSNGGCTCNGSCR